MAISTARIIPLSDLTASQVAQWQELADSALEPNPFFEPAFVIPASRRLPEGVEPAIIFADSAGQLGACLPVLFERRWRRAPLRCVATRPTLSPTLHRTGLGTPLVGGSHGSEALGSLIDVLRQQASRDGSLFLALEVFGVGGTVDQLLREVLGDRGLRSYEYETWARSMVLRREQATYLSAVSSPRHRRELARRRRKIGEELGGVLELVDRSGDPEAVEELLSLEAVRGRAADEEVDGVGEDWFRELCARFRDQGRLYLLSLEAGGRPAAMACYLRAGDGMFCRRISYEPRVARHSPGLHLDVAVIDRFHDDGRMNWMDSCNLPEDRTTWSMWPDRRPVSTLLVPLRRGTGDLAARALVALHAAKQGLRTGKQGLRTGKERLSTEGGKERLG